MVCGAGNLSLSFSVQVISSSLPLHFSNLSPSALECFHFQHSLKNGFFHFICLHLYNVYCHEYQLTHTHTQNGFHQISSSLFFRVSFFLLLYFDAAGFCVCRSKKLDGILVDFAMCALLMRK